jgi:hypothetical protein
VVLRVSEIDRGLLVEAVRLLERAARGESIRDEAERFTAGLEIRLTDETDASGRKVARVYLKRPSR